MAKSLYNREMYGPMLTEREIASFLSVSVATARRWRLDGHGPPFSKLDPTRAGSVRYRKSELIRWIAAKERRAGNGKHAPKQAQKYATPKHPAVALPAPAPINPTPVGPEPPAPGVSLPDRAT